MTTKTEDKAEEKKLSLKEAAELAKVKEKDILAVNDHGDRYHVITKAGQKIVLKK